MPTRGHPPLHKLQSNLGRSLCYASCAMALNETIYTFDIDLADADRHVL